MDFSERFRYLLDCEEISQKEMAAILQISAPTVSNYAQGYREPDFATLTRIADYFGVTTDYLLGHAPTDQAAGQEQALLALFRRFTPAQKSLLLEQAHLLERYNVGCKKEPPANR